MEEIGALATKEHTLEKNLEKMKVEWQDLSFNFVPYRDSVSLSFNSTHHCVSQRKRI